MTCAVTNALDNDGEGRWDGGTEEKAIIIVLTRTLHLNISPHILHGSRQPTSSSRNNQLSTRGRDRSSVRAIAPSRRRRGIRRDVPRGGREGQAGGGEGSQAAAGPRRDAACAALLAEPCVVGTRATAGRTLPRVDTRPQITR